jgi:hypothetical protein
LPSPNPQDKTMNKEVIEYKVLEKEARKLLSKDEVAYYLEKHYKVSLPEEDKQKDLFPVLFSLSTKEVNRLVNIDITNTRMKYLYDIVFYLQHKNKPNKAFFRTQDILRKRYSL